MENGPAISVDQLEKTYREGLIWRKQFEALRGVSFQVQSGEIFGLLGPNGAGKTTFVKIMLGIVRKSGGIATMLGRPAGDRVARQQVGYLPEHLRFPRHLSGIGALQYCGRLSGLSAREIEEKRPALLETVGLADRARDPVRKYSKGMVQRLGLAQALLHDPVLLFLDEPTDGLDPVGRSEVRSIIHQMKSEGKTIFLNSHLLQEVEMVCDRVAILDRGTLKSVGAPDEIVPQGTEGIQVQLELQGDLQVIRTALSDRQFVQPPVMQDDQVRCALQLKNQADVDQCVDALRREGASIVSIARHRVSLEDAFLKILGKESNPS